MELLASDELYWQLEVGMEDPAFLMQLDGLLPQTELNESMHCIRGFKTNADQSLYPTSFHPRELKRASSKCSSMMMMTGHGQEKPSKIQKLNSGEPNVNYESLLDLTSSHVQSYTNSFGLQQDSWYPSSNFEAILDNLPTLKDGGGLQHNSSYQSSHLDATLNNLLNLKDGGGLQQNSSYQSSCLDATLDNLPTLKDGGGLQHNSSYQSSCLDATLDNLPTLKDGKRDLVTPGVSQGSLSLDSCVSEVQTGGSTVFSAKDTALSPAVSSLWSGLYPMDSSKILGRNLKCPPLPVPAKVSGGHSQDHIMAERKRREKLSERFIALSATLPGLKKMDKASILGDAVEYVKQLQDRLKEFEEHTLKKICVMDKASILGDAVEYVKQLQDRLKELEEHTPKKICVAISRDKKPALGIVCTSSDSGRNALETTDDSNNSCEDPEKPEIEVRMVGKNVLIRVQCMKRKGTLVKYLSEIEKLQLSVLNANIISFSETTLVLTFTAQMEDGFKLTAEETLQVLQKIFRKAK